MKELSWLPLKGIYYSVTYTHMLLYIVYSVDTQVKVIIQFIALYVFTYYITYVCM